MWGVRVIPLVLMIVVFSGCQAAPADKTQSSAEVLERLRKIATRSRPASTIHESNKSPSSVNESYDTTTPMTVVAPTLTPALPIVEPEKPVEPQEQSSEGTHSYVLVPVTDQDTISQVQNQVNHFQAINDPYNQIQVIPFRPPLIGNNNNYLNYLNYMNGRRETIIDRVTNFASNFFPVEIDVPDLIGSLTSWIPGASLIGQILTGNRPNSRRYAVLGGNGHVYIVDVPISPVQHHVEPPFIQAPFDNFRSPFRPPMNHMRPFEHFYQRSPYPIPQDFPQRFQNVPATPFPMDFPGLRMQNLRHDLMESRMNGVEPELQENVFQNGFENNPNVNVLPNQMFNGNLHIPAQGLLFPKERSLTVPMPKRDSNKFQLSTVAEESDISSTVT